MDSQQRPRRGPPPPRGKPWEPADEPLRRWESLIERQIREAQEAGAFDDLPHQGEPLPRIDDAYAGEQAAAFRILRSAGIAPGWIEADKEVRALAAERDRVFARAARTSPLMRRRERELLEKIVRAHNAAVARLNHEAPSERLHRLPFDLRADVARLDATWRDADDAQARR